MKITLSNDYPSYYNEEKSTVNLLKYNSDLLKLENKILDKKGLRDTQINNMNDELTVKFEQLKTLNNAWMNIPHKKRPKKEDIEYLQILIIKYAMNIIGTGYISWERFNKSSNTYKEILNITSSQNYIISHEESLKEHIEQEHIELRWSYCIYNFLIQLIYNDTPLEKDFLPSEFQYNNLCNLNITESVNNKITTARVAEFIFNEVLAKRVDKRDYQKLASDIKRLNVFYFTYMITRNNNKYPVLKKEYDSIITETLLFIPQEIKSEIAFYSG